MRAINLFILICLLFLSGCTGWVRQMSNGYLIEEWYKNPNVKDSKSLGGSVNDYITANPDNYLLLYRDHEGNVIPAEDIKLIERSNKWWWKGIDAKEKFIKTYRVPRFSRENKLKELKYSLDHCIYRDDTTPFTLHELNDTFLREIDENTFEIIHRNKEVRKYLEKVAKQRGVEEVNYCTFRTREERTKEYLKILEDENWDWVNENWEDDQNKFYYTKNKDGEYVKKELMSVSIDGKYERVAIKECFKDGFCELYNVKWAPFGIYVKKDALLDADTRNIISSEID